MRTLLFLALALPLAAQRPARLDRPEAEFPEPFSRIVGLRELSSGQVVIADALEQSIARLDFRTGSMTLIGRQGNGPGEFGTPGTLHALAGDTTVMFDFGNARALLITPAGAIAANTISFVDPASGTLVFPRAMDAQGRFYGTASIQFGGGQAVTLPDSEPVIRWRPGGATDTVFRLPMNRQGGLTIRMSGGSAAIGGRRSAYRSVDQWVVTPEGRVALVSADPYRVTWIGAGGLRQPGPTVAYQPVRITQREREEWADQQAGQQISLRTPEGGRTMRTQRPNLDEVDFPEFKPPYDGVRAGPHGEIWARVSRPAGATRELYDVFDAQGRRVRQVELAEGRRLLGFGDGTLYAARVDEDDLQWVERYRL